MTKKVHVVHHTHWDFEWYFTNNESFIQLIYHLDEVFRALEDQHIKYYLLDGQMSIVDDYLQVFPEQKERIKKLVEAGRLFIGPWYTQTDELIVRGESIVRNLNLGMDIAADLGGHMAIGYLPDSFGQSKDMPKIYRGFALERAVFWRGVPDDVTSARVFLWRAEDDSEVLVSNIKDGYFVGGELMYGSPSVQLLQKIAAGESDSQLLLPVGGDQRYVDFDLQERIALYEETFADYTFAESTYDAYFDARAKDDVATIRGEFISGSVSKIHRSIYSSRYDHKYYNDKIERRMLYQLEPLMVMAEQLGIPYKKAALDKIWKLLNKNHAHDSAGGCNSDKTNAQILERFISADQLSYSLVDYVTRKISESRADAKAGDVVIFNPSPYLMQKVVTLQIASKDAAVSLADAQGNLIPTVCVQRHVASNAPIRRDPAIVNEDERYYQHTLQATVSLPAFSFTTYHVVKDAAIEQVVLSEAAANRQRALIENGAYSLAFEDGALTFKDKRTNKVIKDFIMIEDGGDEGDTYDYSPPYKDNIQTFNFAGAQVKTYTSSLQQKMVLKGSWFIAKDLVARENGQCSQAIEYTATFILNKDSGQLMCQFDIANSADDHRMRAIIKTPFKQNAYSYADTPFGTVQRPVEDAHLYDWQKRGWKEEPTAIFPMINYVNAHDETGSMSVFTKGIKEYQFVGEQFENIALTLFRAVGFLGRPDLLRRPGIASGNAFAYIPTPDSQLQKKLKFKFAITLQERFEPAQLMLSYQAYAMSVPYYQIQTLNQFTTTLKYFVSHKLPHPVVQTFHVRLESDTVVWSALTKTQAGAGFDLRVYNPQATESVDGGIIKCSSEVRYTFVNLRGEAQTPEQKGSLILLPKFKAGEIKTIHITV